MSFNCVFIRQVCVDYCFTLSKFVIMTSEADWTSTLQDSGLGMQELCRNLSQNLFLIIT